MENKKEFLTKNILIMFLSPVVLMLAVNMGISEWITSVPKITYLQSFWVCLIVFLVIIIGKKY